MSATAVTGAALLTAVTATISSSTWQVRQTIGLGMATQLMNEVVAAPFPDSPAPTARPTNRIDFTHLDSFDGWTASPPVDAYGYALGTDGSVGSDLYLARPTQMQASPLTLQRYSRSIRVERVAPDADEGWTVSQNDSDFRRVSVVVRHHGLDGRVQEVANLTRIVARVPHAP